MRRPENTHRGARILIVDDQEANVRLLLSTLRQAGFTEVTSTTDPHRALELYRKVSPDLVLLDLHMPELDGFGILERLAPEIPPDAYVPILVLTADITAEAKRRALSAGAKDFLTKPFDITEVLLRIGNLLETRFLHLRLRNQNEILEEKVKERTAGLWESIQSLTEAEANLRSSRGETIERLAAAAELRDEETGWHIKRMSYYSELLARRAGIDDEQSESIRLASLLHDIGKVGIPDRILRKKGKLTVEEFTAIKEHAAIGHRVLAGSQTELLSLAGTIAWTHHEKWDGSGYPRGLSGEDIPIEGRIAAVADVFDALTSPRVYRRRPLPLGEALDILRGGRERHFDPRLVNVFLASIGEVLEIQERYPDTPGDLAGEATAAS